MISELQLINKILTDKNFEIITDNLLTIDYFVQCKKEFSYLEDFYTKYHTVPDKETFTSKFPDFEYFTVYEPVKSIVDDMREQRLFQKAVSLINQSSKLFEKDANEGAKFLLDHISELQPNYSISYTDAVKDSSKRLESWKSKMINPSLNYIDLPFKEMSEDLFGFQRGEEMFLFLAKSSQGKSQILTVCAEYAAKQGYRVGFISPEMSSESILYRYDTAKKHFSNMALQKGLVIPEYENYIQELQKSNECFLVSDINDFDGHITFQKVENYVKALNLDILFLDGLSYVRPDTNFKGMTETQVLGNACRNLLAMSNKYKIPVVGVVQARRRANESRFNTEESSMPDSESVFDSYQVTQYSTRIVSLQKMGKKEDKVLQFYIAKNRYGKDDKKYTYAYDYDRLNFFYIPDIEDLKKTNPKEVEETKESFKAAF